MDAVLGLSMTPTSVGLVLVEGQEADGATMDRDAFDVQDGARYTSEQAAAAIRRTEAVAANRGVRLHSIGVTWSEDADDQASALMQSLSDSGFDNVVAIRLPEATEALARGIADVMGFETTAVCVIEPDTVIALIVHAGGPGAVQTAVNHAIDTEESLISWLSSVFAKADWQPEALVVVGSAGGFDDFPPLLQDALAVPVFSPAEAELALARGAALASTSTPMSTMGLPFDAYVPVATTSDEPRTFFERRLSAQTGAVALLVAGVVTFVVSVSVAVSLQLSPRQQPAEVSSAGTAAAVEAPAARPGQPPVARPNQPPAAPVISPPAAPVPPPPVAEAPLPESPPVLDAPPAVGEAPPVDAPLAPPVDAPYAEAPQGEVAPAPEAGPPLPGPVAVPQDPAIVAPPVATVPAKKPLRTRIMDRIRGIGDGQ